MLSFSKGCGLNRSLPAGKFLMFSRSLHSTARRSADFSHVVIGGGIIGTSIAAEVSCKHNNVLLLEKNQHLGQETTLRNSEVIHAGLYYPKESLKSKLCIEGKNLLYNAVESGVFSTVQVGIKKCGKLILAADEQEAEYLYKIHKFTNNEVKVPTSFVSKSDLRQKYPHLAGELALDSPTTGIVSAHDLLLFQQTRFENNEGTIAYNTKVTGLDYDGSTYTLTCTDADGNQFQITSDIVVNSAGLHATKVSNYLLPQDRHYTPYFGKGTYFSYLPIKSLGAFTDKLLYPCPNPNASSLGIHLTFDIGGQIKFGPDLEWLDIKDADEIDYSPSEYNLAAAYKAVRRYFPALRDGELTPSYSGVRPKINSLADSKKEFADFIIKEEEDYPGFVNLIGMESPGVTGSWAIGKYVNDILHK